MFFQNWCKMATKNETPKNFPVKRVQKTKPEFSWEFMGNLFVKAGSNELLRKALKKLANASEKTLTKFLGERIMLFGRLKRVVSDIYLEATSSFFISSFFKTKAEGGIWAYVDGDIAKSFDDEVKNSPEKELSSYEFTEDITEENLIGDAKAGDIYDELDFAHIKQICYSHIILGQKILNEDGKSNIFWVRNKKGDLCRVYVWLDTDGWYVRVDPFSPQREWCAGGLSFFCN